MTVAKSRQVAEPYTQSPDGSHEVVFAVDSVDATSNVVVTGAAKEIEIKLSTNYTVIVGENPVNFEIAKKVDSETSAVTAATADSPALSSEFIGNFYFSAGAKISVFSDSASTIALVPSVE